MKKIAESPKKPQGRRKKGNERKEDDRVASKTGKTGEMEKKGKKERSREQGRRGRAGKG